MKSLTAEANPISTSIHEEMNKNNCSIEDHFNFKFIAISLFYICVSGFHQINRINRRYILKKLLLDIGLWNCKDCQSKPEIYRKGYQEGQVGTLWDELKLISIGGISS